jgi:hypothetical protein
MELPALATSARLPRRPDLNEAAVLLGLGGGALAIAAAAVEQPRLVLIAAIAVAVLVTALLRTDLAILLVVAAAPLESAFASGPGGISITKITGAILFASFALTILRRQGTLLIERGQAIVLGILAIAMLSTLQAQQPSAAVTTTTRYASFAIFYVIVTQFAQSAAVRRRIIWVLAASTTASAILGLYEYFRGSSPVATLRYSNADDFGFVLATSLPLMFWLLTSRRKLWPVVFAMIGICFAALLLSLARGSLVGLGVAFVFLLLTDRRRLRLSLVAGGLATIAAVLVINTNPARFQNALVLKSQVAQENVATRYQVWGAAARLATNHPFLGVGPGNFQFYYFSETGRPVGTAPLTVAHNAFLDIGAELGLGAMCLFALYLVVSFVRLSETIGKGVTDVRLAQALRISLVAGAVTALTLSEQYYLPFWLIGGLATGLWFEVKQQASADEGTTA